MASTVMDAAQRGATRIAADGRPGRAAEFRGAGLALIHLVDLVGAVVDAADPTTAESQLCFAETIRVAARP